MRPVEKIKMAGGPPPIHRLPPELLTRVFRELQLSLGWTWMHVTLSYLGYEATTTWIWVTWTCSYWRVVAIESPQLWTLIVVNRTMVKTWTPTFLERSMAMPLMMMVETTIEDTQPMVDVCLPHAHRIRRLHVKGPSCGLIVPSTRRFDVLEELYVSRSHRLETHRYDVPDSSRILHLRGEDFPRLNTLDIDVGIEWDTFSLISLHELQLKRLPFGTCATTVLRILQNFPGLRVFILPRQCTVWLLPGIHSWADTMGTVSLAHLHKIDLCGPPWILTHTLDRVIVPSGRFHIDLVYYGTLDEARDLSIAPLEIILPRQLIFRSLLPHCTTLALSIQGGFTDISASDDSGSCSLGLKMGNELFFNATGVPVLTEAIWTSVLDAFSPSPLSRFCLAEYRTPEDVTADMWTTLFGRFSLDSVEARFSGAKEEFGKLSLLENLFAALRDPSAHRIRTLELAFLAITSSTAGAIMDLLDDRASMGAPLEKLVFAACFCDSSSLDAVALKTKLESVVNLAIWNNEDTDTPDGEFRTYDIAAGPCNNVWWSV